MPQSFALGHFVIYFWSEMVLESFPLSKRDLEGFSSNALHSRNTIQYLSVFTAIKTYIIQENK
ncbi:MAG: hypothetical protein QG641_1257 [Candidatus Poribacteria bacterium]|nr:hypothetical protein [Candidatus Poribacteria bacterium]MDQ1327972.1 hypothetical protein [Candidatus Poribacteria bacterium]